MKTYSPKPRDIERRWYVIDADGVVLGRLASETAAILRGKHKPIYAPHADTGDHVIVINAAKIRVTGGKETKKTVYRHSGYPGGLTEASLDRLLTQRPSTVIERAVRGMLPKNSLGRSMLRKLSVYDGADHPHAAQKPEALSLGQVPRWEGLPVHEAPVAAAKTPATKPARKPAATKAPAPKPAAKKPASRKPAAKTPATKSAAKRSAAGTSAKKTSAAKKPAAKKSPAKKPTAKRTARRKRGEGDDT
jgi:large subunit ribosomal protein L13